MQLDHDLLNRLRFSHHNEGDAYNCPPVLKNSVRLIFDYFKTSTTNKLCLVFPARGPAAQWISVQTALALIQHDFAQNENAIVDSYKHYKAGDRLLLNNLAVVEWVGIMDKTHIAGPTFRTKHTNRNPSAEITIKFSDIMMLQKAPASKKALSSLERVVSALPSRSERIVTPLERLLCIDTFGNREFIKSSICLVSKFKSYYDSVQNILLNGENIDKYFEHGRVNEDGIENKQSPLLISNNISDVLLGMGSKSISAIVVDGYSAINERKGDFLDLDREHSLRTVLVTDLSELAAFEEIRTIGFDVFSFAKENSTIEGLSSTAPFYVFDRKLSHSLAFKVKREICHSPSIEEIIKRIQALPKDDSNNDLYLLRSSLFHFSHLVARICYMPRPQEIEYLTSQIDHIEAHYLKNKLWLAEASLPLEGIIGEIHQLIDSLSRESTDKCRRLTQLLRERTYDYIICATAEEARTLEAFLGDLNLSRNTRVVSVVDVNDSLISDGRNNAILTGWPKVSNLNRILFSFVYAELTVLFYQFEDAYYLSLQRRNRGYVGSISTTVDLRGCKLTAEAAAPTGFEELFAPDETVAPTSENKFNIVDFEDKIDRTQYSKYFATDNPAESCKARRIDFVNNTFTYATESHKFIVLNELFSASKNSSTLHAKRFESLRLGDVIAFINTERDILVELVERETDSRDYAAVKGWTDLWKDLLKDYFASIDYHFKRLVRDLRAYGCKKHEVTIRTWLQDENRIGPNDDADLLSIAYLTKSQRLKENIPSVRSAISTMTGWRMKASDSVRDKIKRQLADIAEPSIINSTMEIQDLGKVEILKVHELNGAVEEVDKRYVNRLLHKEVL